MHFFGSVSTVLLLCSLAAPLGAGEIHEAIRRGDAAAVERLIAADPSLLRAKDADGSPPLNVAAQAGNVALARLLLDAGADINLGDNEGSNSLHLAASGGGAEMIDFLLSRGMDVNSADDNGSTAVLFAGGRRHWDVVRHLASKGGKLDCRTNGGSTLVHHAAYQGNLEVLRELAAKGLPLDAGADQWGNTPLTAAAMRNRIPVIEYLLENGASINETMRDGRTALITAAMQGHRPVAEFLLAKGADPNIAWRGAGALAFATMSGDPEFVRLLLAHGADPNAADEGGWNAMHRLAYGGGVETARLLVEAGCEHDRKNREGMTPMIIAANRGHADLVRYLISCRAATEAVESAFGWTALHIAAAKGYGDVAGALLEAGAPVNAKDRFGKTPLHYAVRHGNAAVADAIKAKGGKGGGKEAAAPFSRTLAEGEAVIHYTGHSGWVVRTKNNVMIFDYFEDGRMPDAPSLLNGCIDTRELRGKKVTAFVSHTAHADHYNKANFRWNRDLDDITWVMGQAPDTSVTCVLIEPRQTKNLGGIEVTAIRSTDAGVGFLVTVDGVTFLHSGDHHNRDANVDGPYAGEIDFLAELGRRIDFAFFPVSGCGFGDQEIVKKGVFFAANKLRPDYIFPMHGGDSCSPYNDFAGAAAQAGCTVPMSLPKTNGDRFLLRDGMLKEI